MSRKRTMLTGGLTLVAVLGVTGTAVAGPGHGHHDGRGGGGFEFTPLAASATCTNGGNGEDAAPFVLPEGFTQTVIAQEGDGGAPDLWDMNTLNESGPLAGRFLFRPHEIGANGAVSGTDLRTGQTRIVAQRADWERLDGIVWTPWRSIVTAEETTRASLPDPAVPQARAGLVYEIDPVTGESVVRPAVGSRSHEGLRFDSRGNLYGISETNPGYVYKFVPDRRGDLSAGQLYALKIVQGDKSNGRYEWLPLDRNAVQVDSDAEAGRVGATSFNRPEDVETGTSTGESRGGEILYVAVTGEDAVYAVDLKRNRVATFVQAGVNAPPGEFDSPDNLALDQAGTLYITEDPGGTPPAKTTGDDIWAAGPGGNGLVAHEVTRFASLTDCFAEPTGIYFDLAGETLYVNAQHRGGNGTRDQAIAVRQD
jgi:secreted PhoX family phosphatase